MAKKILYAINCTCKNKTGILLTVIESTCIETPCNDCPETGDAIPIENAKPKITNNYEAILQCKKCKEPIIINEKEKLVQVSK